MTTRRDNLKERLQDSHIPLKISDKSGVWHEILVRKQVSMRDVQRYVVRKLSLGNDTDFALVDAQTKQPIAAETTAAQLPDSILLRLLKKTQLDLTLGAFPVVDGVVIEKEIIELVEAENRQRFKITEFPALIGRSKRTGTAIEPLIVDLVNMKDGRTVSGRHARISKDEENYYIENLTQDNRLVINGTKIAYQDPQIIRSDDLIEIGRVRLQCFITKPRIEL